MENEMFLARRLDSIRGFARRERCQEARTAQSGSGKPRVCSPRWLLCSVAGVSIWRGGRKSCEERVSILLDIFQAEHHLFLGQHLRPAAEAPIDSMRHINMLPDSIGGKT